MFVGTIRKGISIQGYLDKGFLEPTQIRQRHDALVHEMKRRHMNHQSPLPDFPTPSTRTHVVDVQSNYIELENRCPSCKELIRGNKPLEVPVPTILEEDGDFLAMELIL